MQRISELFAAAIVLLVALLSAPNALGVCATEANPGAPLSAAPDGVAEPPPMVAATPQANGDPEALLEEARARRAELDGQTDLGEAELTRARAAWDAAIADYKAAVANRQLVESWRTELDPEPVAPPELPAVPPREAPLASLQEARDDFRAAIPSLESRIADLDARLGRRSARRDSRPVDLSAARTALSELRAAPAPVSEGMDERLAAALVAERSAAITRLEARIEMLIRDAEWFNGIQTRLTAEKRTYEAALEDAEARRDEVQRRLVANSLEEATDDVARSERVVGETSEALRAVAAENVAIAARRVARLQQHGEVLQKSRLAARDAERLERRLDALRRRAEKALSTQQIAGLLRKERKDLVDPRVLQRELGSVVERSSTLELDAIDLEERIDALARPNGDDDELTSSEREAESADQAGFAALMKERLRLLRAEHASLEELLSELALLEGSILSQRDRARDLKSFVEERVLWVRSADPIWIVSWRELRDGTFEFFSLERLEAFPASVFTALLAAPLRTFALLVAAWFLFLLRRRLGERIEARIGPDAPPEERRKSALSIRPTVEQLVRGMFGAAILPLVVAAFALSLRDHAEAGSLAHSLGAGVSAALPSLFALDLTRRIARPGGLGEAPLQWGATNMRTLRAHLRWFLPTYILLTAASAAVHASERQPLIDSAGRIFFDALIVSTGIVLALLLRSDGLTPLANRPSVLARLRGLWFAFGVGTTTLLAAGSLVGFHFTAQNLWLPFEKTIALLGALLVLRALVARWILVNRRRLRIEQARERRAKAELEKDVPAERRGLEADTDEQVDLGSLEEEMGELLRFGTGSAALVGILAIWQEFFPALGRLRGIRLYSTDAGVEFTAWNVGAAALVVGLVIVLAKRLPGLLEFAVLNRFKLGSGERYAIRAVTSYIVVTIGVLIALQLLGVTWGSVQWLAAAVSVGLGFGLQEIFANFVSGLILLFERPIRVGDLVTVAGSEGRVTEIRIRATTILDYDRRELIVPNREFVTSSLVNWTLSDPITRLVIKVGIAYGSDVEKAKRLMLHAAADCRKVIKEPKSSVVFKGFGESSLDFDVRVFMADRDDWPEVIDFMHARIDALFREEGVEIPFPQRDLHVRTAAPGILEVFGHGR